MPLASGEVGVTSRIWHRFSFDSNSNSITGGQTESDPSKAPWEDEHRTYKGKLAPTGSTAIRTSKTLKNGIHSVKIEGKYGGVNHAMPGSSEMQEAFGVSYVPTLDVSYKMMVDVDSKNGHIDVVTYVSGDGFPNCEAFIVGPNGKPVFLGVHSRKGAAPTTLMLNAGFPMIASAIRLPIDHNGNFTGQVGDELARRAKKKPTIEYQSIQTWNQKFLNTNPNRNHCMGLESIKRLSECF